MTIRGRRKSVDACVWNDPVAISNVHAISTANRINSPLDFLVDFFESAMLVWLHNLQFSKGNYTNHVDG